MRKAKHSEPNGWCRAWQVGRGGYAAGEQPTSVDMKGPQDVWVGFANVHIRPGLGHANRQASSEGAQVVTGGELVDEGREVAKPVNPSSAGHRSSSVGLLRRQEVRADGTAGSSRISGAVNVPPAPPALSVSSESGCVGSDAQDITLPSCDGSMLMQRSDNFDSS
jgi:hypothetical protein